MRDELIEAECEAQLDELAGLMSRPQLALEALGIYRASGLPVPEWALEEIEDAYEHFKRGAPVAGWPRETWATPAPRSLGEAFSIGDVKGEQLYARRRRAMMAPLLADLFYVRKVYPKSEAGFRAAATALRISEKQVKTWLRAIKPTSAPK